MKNFASLALILGLVMPSTSLASDNARLTPQNGKKMSDAIERVKDAPALDTQINIDIKPRPEDNGGNLFLVGFESVDAHGKPLPDTAPSDFRQLGIWVQKWPFSQELELIQGLYYMALYGYSEYPSPSDIVSEAVQLSGDNDEVLSLVILANYSKNAEGSPPGQVETKVILPEDLQEQPVRLTIHMNEPLTDWEGNVFLTGFSDFDTVLRMPIRDSTPEHFITLQTTVQEFPLVVETQLRPDFAYFAMMGQGNHPEPGDQMSHAVVFEGGDSLEITILDQTVGKPPKDAPVEAIEMQQQEAAGDAAPDVPEPNALPPEFTAPKEKTAKAKGFLLGIAAAGVFFGLLHKKRNAKPQGISSRLERVGESDESS